MNWRNHPAINSFTRQNGVIGQVDMERWRHRIAKDPSIEMFGILATDKKNENIGTCGLTSISYIHGTAEFSLLINPELQGRGYGTDSLKALLQYGFENMRLNCIWGETFETNPALKMFKKIGMTEEGRLRQRYFKAGKYLDSIIVSILASEFKT